jgi:hypothetical protein
MKKIVFKVATILFITIHLQAQVEPNAGNWKTWFIKSARDYRLPAPPSYKNEIEDIVAGKAK